MSCERLASENSELQVISLLKIAEIVNDGTGRKVVFGILDGNTKEIQFVKRQGCLQEIVTFGDLQIYRGFLRTCRLLTDKLARSCSGYFSFIRISGYTPVLTQSRGFS